MGNPALTPTPMVTLTTDFGDRDHYVASMKGALLSLNPSLKIIDITHQIAPHQIAEAAFTLGCAVPTFPDGTIHIVVVDPGVGTRRRLLLASTERHYFLAPDNGTLGLVFDAEPALQVVQLTQARYFRQDVSSTFHGRDILAPVAAHLSLGTDMSQFGDPVQDWMPCAFSAPVGPVAGRLGLKVLAVDRFGNVILNLKRRAYREAGGRPAPGALTLEIGGRTIRRLLLTYDEADDGEPFALFNSCDYLEIAARQGSAAAVLGVLAGHPATVVL
ncbi:MAG TPA: SAM-dependent chlorinase/fluorinase [Candidatus Polarisedimenticolia bacterium]|nr:SAM-dependent chlorinase/fluorinase [Candidatus Polarisedimenticolia bacterium]